MYNSTCVYFRQSKLAIFKEEDTSSSSEDENNPQHQTQEIYIPTKDPTETIFENGLQNMNDFLSKVQKFESVTQDRMKDLWRL